MNAQGTSRDPVRRIMPLRAVAAICCALFLVVDLFSLTTTYQQYSRADITVARALGWEQRRVTLHPFVDIVIAETPDGPECAVHPDLLPEAARHAPLATFSLWPPSPPTGWWAGTRIGPTHGTYVSPDGSKSDRIPPQQLVGPIRAFIASTYEPWKLARYDELIATGGTGSRPRWTGYLHNAVSALAATALLLCVSSLTLDFIRHLRDTRFPRGHCGRCGYDLSGLAVGSACPECGPSRHLKGG